MKLFSKTLARILGKKEETDVTQVHAVDLIIFNQGDQYEFAECGNCGCEIDPPGKGLPYPVRCPKCGWFFDWSVKAEDVK